MLIYRSVEVPGDARHLVDSVAQLAARLRASPATTHEDWTDLLLETADLETSVVDAHHEAVDDVDITSDALRRLSRLVACGFVASSRGDQVAAASVLARVVTEL